MKKVFFGILIFYIVGMGVAGQILYQNKVSFENTVQALTVSAFIILMLIALGIFLAKLISIFSNRRKKDLQYKRKRAGR